MDMTRVSVSRRSFAVVIMRYIPRLLVAVSVRLFLEEIWAGQLEYHRINLAGKAIADTPSTDDPTTHR